MLIKEIITWHSYGSTSNKFGAHVLDQPLRLVEKHFIRKMSQVPKKQKRKCVRCHLLGVKGGKHLISVKVLAIFHYGLNHVLKYTIQDVISKVTYMRMKTFLVLVIPAHLSLNLMRNFKNDILFNFINNFKIILFQINCCVLIGIMTLTCTPTPKSPLQDILPFLLRIYPFFLSFKEP